MNISFARKQKFLDEVIVK